MYRDYIVLEENSVWRYPVNTILDKTDTEEDLVSWGELLSLVVPGLQVLRSGFETLRDKSKGYLWFTWSEEAMWSRLQDCFEEFGVSDERLAYLKCSGMGDNGHLPGVVYPETPIRSIGPVFSSWTLYGLQKMESGFAQRILHPNKGGPYAVPYPAQRCIVGNEWWLVGTKGDSKEILTQEILGSPLGPLVKENLLSNLDNYR